MYPTENTILTHIKIPLIQLYRLLPYICTIQNQNTIHLCLLSEKRQQKIAAVSYTHLDVYKRQGSSPL